MVKSLLQRNKACYVCGTTLNLHLHHIFYGTANRRLRAGDMPVTLINNVIYGVEEVADKRFKRDVEQANYDANKEHINVTKLKLRILEAQLSREWGAAGKGEL